MENYFIVYPNHTEIVGQIDDKELSRAIIDTYNKANYILDGMKVNNWYLDRITEYGKRVAENLPGNHASTNLHNYETLLADFAPGLRQGYQKLKEVRGDLFAKIDKYLASHQPDS